MFTRATPPPGTPGQLPEDNPKGRRTSLRRDLRRILVTRSIRILLGPYWRATWVGETVPNFVPTTKPYRV